MKTIKCPHCGEEVKVRTRISMTVDDGKVKEKMPKDVMGKIVSAFTNARGLPYNQKSFMIYGKAAKELYNFCEKDLLRVLASIEKAKDFYTKQNFDKWVLTSIIKQWDEINKPEKNLYEGW